MIEFDPESVIRNIMRFAAEDDNVRYVIQNGSRVNPSVQSDVFADFDIIMGCANPEKFVQDRRWIDYFGDLLILQLNELNETGVRWPIFLMQFKNGVRIDLQFYPGDGISKYRKDSLSKILLDKDHLFTALFPPSEESYIVHKPESGTYVKTVNDFWWCAINTGKSLARHELTYSRYMYESIVRENFLHIIGWYVSSKHGWQINTGKFGKFLSAYADNQLWNKIEKTYYTDSPDVFWKSLFEACTLIASIDAELRKELNILIKPEDTQGIISFLETIKKTCTNG